MRLANPILKDTVEKCDSRSGRIFDLCIQALIVLSLISFSMETLPNLSSETKNQLRIFEVFTVMVFTAEYLLRIFVANSKRHFVFSFYGLVDLLAILPFYIVSGIDLRSIRIFRLFRLFKTFKLFRYSQALNRMYLALKNIREELILFLIATSFVLYISAVGIYYFENPVQPDIFSSIFASLWWSVVSITTVGYGDMYPVTVGGRVFTVFVLILGIGIVAVPTSLLAAALSKTSKTGPLNISDIDDYRPALEESKLKSHSCKDQ